MRLEVGYTTLRCQMMSTSKVCGLIRWTFRPIVGLGELRVRRSNYFLIVRFEIKCISSLVLGHDRAKDSKHGNTMRFAPHAYGIHCFHGTLL